MRYSTKLWILVFIFLLARLLYWSAFPPYNHIKEVVNLVLIACYLTFCLIELLERYDYPQLKYFNIFYLLYIGIVKLNNWIDKQE